MDFDAGLLLFIFIFFVLPIIQRVLGGAKQAPPGGRPGQGGPGVPSGEAEDRARLPHDARAGTLDGPDVDGPPVRAQAERTQAERAADMIPDDLWEVLTGERRSPASSQRQRAPAPEPEREAEPEPYEWGTAWRPEEATARLPETYDDDDAYDDALASGEASRRREHEEFARPTTPAPTPTPAPIRATDRASRHSPSSASPYAIAGAAAAGPSRGPSQTPEPQRRRKPRSLSNRSELKRAFVLREVLGPPKALE